MTSDSPPEAPRAVIATSALLVGLAPALVLRDAPGTAAWLVLAAVVPWWPRRQELAIAIAYLGAGWCLWSLVRVPLGARVGVYLVCGVALVLRALAVRTEATRRWCEHARHERS